MPAVCVIAISLPFQRDPVSVIPHLCFVQSVLYHVGPSTHVLATLVALAFEGPRWQTNMMNLKSKYFDMIRAERRRETVADHTPRCDWPDCSDAAPHPAPAGPREAGRRHFCREHITRYNMSYDFFEGMSAEDVEQYRTGATTGHRPTWSLGARRGAQGSWQFEDPLEIMTHAGPVAGETVRGRRVSTGQKRALDILDLDAAATAEDVRGAFKSLVKKLHPDANGGDRKHEERLQRVIKAHEYLKASGFC
ncbi:MAG: hypothetical protein CBD03_04220 [Rhizobiales bacterium TMED143]|nr:molecular chaperone DnaJ [Rhodobiaceae bacterium]OUV92272.1 MAG: hypothetical protein CBD03_04220 [Rhizobiales bacterium TMED143]HCQ81495.1 molecular chaperone DnaJ [Rhodobiaceae bacterium]